MDMNDIVASLVQASQAQQGRENIDALNAIRLANTQKQAEADRRFFTQSLGRVPWINTQDLRVDPNERYQEIMNSYTPYRTE